MTDDRALFELLVLEGAQAGLSWWVGVGFEAGVALGGLWVAFEHASMLTPQHSSRTQSRIPKRTTKPQTRRATILKKRAAYRAGFAEFDPVKVAAFGDADVSGRTMMVIHWRWSHCDAGTRDANKHRVNLYTGAASLPPPAPLTPTTFTYDRSTSSKSHVSGRAAAGPVQRHREAPWQGQLGNQQRAVRGAACWGRLGACWVFESRSELGWSVVCRNLTQPNPTQPNHPTHPPNPTPFFTRCLLKIQQLHGSFSSWLWSFVPGARPIVNRWTEQAQMPTQ